MTMTLLEIMRTSSVIPVIAIDDPDHACRWPARCLTTRRRGGWNNWPTCRATGACMACSVTRRAA